MATFNASTLVKLSRQMPLSAMSRKKRSSRYGQFVAKCSVQLTQ